MIISCLEKNLMDSLEFEGIIKSRFLDGKKYLDNIHKYQERMHHVRNQTSSELQG